jgi:GntR family transcriptional regulator, transcriptional repressor for pyruvate dehydrogenase complex
MSMALVKVSRQRVSDQILDQLKSRILDGTLPAGEPLPPELELRDLFGASRTSVREAVRQLELLGLVESRQGSRRIVRTRDELWALPLLRELLAPRGELDPALLPHLLQAHRDFLALLYEHAAEHGGTEQWAALRELVTLQEAEPDRERFLRRDFEFWLGLADIGGNRVYSLLMRGFGAALEPLLPRLALVMPETMLSRPFYRPMLEALESGRASELREPLRRLLEEDGAALLENLLHLHRS